MPLKVITLTEQLLEILMAPARHGLTVAETCRRYGISRQTFYQYRARYREHGVDGLQPRSRRPLSCRHQTPPEVEDLIVALRKERPRWGARKIRAMLQRRGSPTVPAVSTVHQILVRNGLVGIQPRRRRLAWRRFERPVPNDLWQIDATQVQLADGTKAWVIDIVDDHARFAIAAHACRAATTCSTKPGAGQPLRESGGSSTTSWMRHVRAHVLAPDGYLIAIATPTVRAGRYLDHATTVIAAAKAAGLCWQQQLLHIRTPLPEAERANDAAATGVRIARGRHQRIHDDLFVLTTGGVNA